MNARESAAALRNARIRTHGAAADAGGARDSAGVSLGIGGLGTKRRAAGPSGAATGISTHPRATLHEVTSDRDDYDADSGNEFGGFGGNSNYDSFSDNGDDESGNDILFGRHDHSRGAGGGDDDDDDDEDEGIDARLRGERLERPTLLRRRGNTSSTPTSTPTPRPTTTQTPTPAPPSSDAEAVHDEQTPFDDNDLSTRWERDRRLVALATIGEKRLLAAETKGVVRQYERVLAEPRTEEEAEYQVDHDEDSLRWRPTKHPRYAALDTALGQPAPRADCWGCLHGNRALSSVAAQRLDELQSLYTDNRHEVDAAALGRLLERFFEKHIRGPANEAIVARSMARGGNNCSGTATATTTAAATSIAAVSDADLVPAWSAATIVDHFTNHRTEPQAKLSKRLDQVGALADHLFDNGLFRVPANATPDEIKSTDVRVSEKHARLFMTSVAMELRLHAAVPARMYGHNADLNIEAKARPFVRARHNMVEHIRAIKPFDAEPPQPL